MKEHFELSTTRQLELNMYLKKMFLLIINLDLTRSYEDINIPIIKLFEKAYIRYN